MDSGKIGVGIVGVEPGRSWSAIAHIPALRALPEFELVAVCTTRQASAAAAARTFGIPHAFADYQAFLGQPGVDLVAVTVKVPHHLELVTAALEAGKAVYCEWPLGNGLVEAVRMAELARSRRVYAAVGLQARAAPAIAFVKDLIDSGYVGDVLSTTLIGSGMNWGAFVERPNVYTLDRSNGATLLTIPFGHTVDALCHLLGEFEDLVAVMANRRRTSTIVGTTDVVPMTAEDQLVVTGRLQSGTVAAIHYRGGMPGGTGLLWEINGTAGDLQVTAIGGHAQLFDLTLKGAPAGRSLEPLEIPAKYRWAPAVPGVAFNVAQAYARVAEDLSGKTQRCAGFDDAVVRHRLIAAVEESARSGKRVAVAQA